MATKKIQTGLRINESTYTKIRVLSDIENRSMNNLIEHVLQQYVDQYEKANGILLEPSEK